VAGDKWSAERLLTASGTIEGLIDLAKPASWGPVELWPENGEVHFRVALDITDRVDEEMEQLIDRVAPAIEAAVAANCGASVRVHLLDHSYPHRTGSLNAVGKRLTLSSSTRVAVNMDPKSDRGQHTLEALLDGADLRLAKLYEVYLLGLRAIQTVAPVVGLCAFSAVIEEEVIEKARRKKGEDAQSLKHVPRLIDDLRQKGHSIPESPSGRNAASIRTAALHAPKQLERPNPPPTVAEIDWFRQIADAYLVDRATLTKAKSKVSSLRTQGPL